VRRTLDVEDERDESAAAVTAAKRRVVPVTCKELADYLDDYIAGTMPVVRRNLVDQHLAVCPDCQHYLASYRLTVGLGKAAFADPDEQVPVSVPEGLLAALRASRPTES
jgi:anti-sigma factor RsiW